MRFERFVEYVMLCCLLVMVIAFTFAICWGMLRGVV